MDLGLPPGLAAVLLGVLCLVLAVVVTVLVAGRRTLRRELAAARADVQALGTRVAEIEQGASSAPSTAVASAVPPAEFVITSAGAAPARHEPDRTVLSVRLGEPLVKALAFGYGVRRALSAETRNRIAFEMRREVRRARKERRRLQRRARREANAMGRGATGATASSEAAA